VFSVPFTARVAAAAWRICMYRQWR
jgi:hypothetical protein